MLIELTGIITRLKLPDHKRSFLDLVISLANGSCNCREVSVGLLEQMLKETKKEKLHRRKESMRLNDHCCRRCTMLRLLHGARQEKMIDFTFMRRIVFPNAKHLKGSVRIKIRK